MGSVTHQVQQTKAILLLHGNARDRNYFKRKLSEHAPHAEVYTVCVWPKDYQMMPIFEECCKLIETFNITLVINKPEIGMTILSALLTKYSLPGPSFLATFLTMNKRYTREVIAAPLGLNVPFATIMEGGNMNSLRECLKPLPPGKKVIAKPIYANGSLCLRVLGNKDEVLSAEFHLSLTALQARDQCQYYSSIIPTFLQNHQYNLGQGYLVELYAEKDPEVATFHGVDGLIYKKSFIPWIIRDQLYWPRRRECHLGSAFPTSLTAEMQGKVWEVVASIADKLIEYGFDYQFFEAELIVFKTGRIALMEINGRMPLTMTSQAYTDVLVNGDPTQTILRMAEGRDIEAPTLKDGTHGLFAYVSMLSKGKVSDIIDVDKINRSDNIDLNKKEDEVVDATNSIAGINLGMVHTTGNSRKECIGKAKSLITGITKVKDSSPWFTDEYA